MEKQLTDDLIGFFLSLEQNLQRWAEKQTDKVSAEVMRHYAYSAQKLAEDVARSAVVMDDGRK